RRSALAAQAMGDLRRFGGSHAGARPQDEVDGRVAPAGDPVPPYLESVQPLQHTVVAGAQGGEIGAAQHDAVGDGLLVRLRVILEIVEEPAAAPGSGGTLPGGDLHRARSGRLVLQARGEEAPRLRAP